MFLILQSTKFNLGLGKMYINITTKNYFDAFKSLKSEAAITQLITEQEDNVSLIYFDIFSSYNIRNLLMHLLK